MATKAELEKQIDAMSETIIRLTQTKRSQRGMLVAQGQEIKTLRRDKDFWKARDGAEHHRYQRLNKKYLEAYEFIYRVGGEMKDQELRYAARRLMNKWTLLEGARRFRSGAKSFWGEKI